MSAVVPIGSPPITNVCRSAVCTSEAQIISPENSQRDREAQARRVLDHSAPISGNLGSIGDPASDRGRVWKDSSMREL